MRRTFSPLGYSPSSGSSQLPRINLGEGKERKNHESIDSVSKETLLFLVTLTCFGLPAAITAVSPPRDGGYPNQNTAEGDNALLSLTLGIDNMAVGYQALFSQHTGPDNTAIGDGALGNNTSSVNTATGTIALVDNTTGNSNTADGALALENNTTGSNNVALGYSAGSNLTTGSNNIDIGANVHGLAGEANTICIGKSGTQMKTLVAGIRGAIVANGVG